MKASRTIHPSDLRLIYFGTKDVLQKKEERAARKSKLHQAKYLSNYQQIPVNIYLRLPNGETVETQSHCVDFTDEFVTINNMHFVPILAIVDIAAESLQEA